MSWLIDQLVPQLDIRDPEAVKVAVDKIEQELGIPNVVRIHLHNRLILNQN